MRDANGTRTERVTRTEREHVANNTFTDVWKGLIVVCSNKDELIMPKWVALKQSDLYPPSGGWGVTVYVKGHPFHLTGSPNAIVSRWVDVHVKNGEEVTEAEAREALNAIWCARSPERCKPGYRKMAMSLAAAVRDEVVAVARKEGKADVEERLRICGMCDFFRKGVCMKCGCALNLKTRLRASHCPIGKW